MVSKKPKNFNSSIGMTFYIVGPRRLQNELIASCLKKETGNECFVLENINHISTEHSEQDDRPGLIFWDCHGKNTKKLLDELRNYTGRGKSANRIIFFNVSKRMKFNKKFVIEGIRGFFYEHDPLDNFMKGVRAVIDGKLWLSREMMTKCIFEGSGKDKSSKSGSEDLTERQIEILALVAVGATNEEIADRLCISPHTVKTHVYKIFKEINVPNRVQAALWAASNL